jgi:translocator protein
MMKRQQVLVLACCLLLCLGAGWVGSLATQEAVKTWYPTIAKPVFNPPSWVFGPVWTILYVLMGVSLFLVVRDGKLRAQRTALVVFGAQLVLNTLWSFLFFGAQRPGVALVEILLLWGAILWTIILFGRRSRTAAMLLYPYIAWVSFATVLNVAIWWLN